MMVVSAGHSQNALRAKYKTNTGKKASDETLLSLS
jgi:hypothetical protein